MLRQRLPIGLALILVFSGLLAIDGQSSPYFLIWHTLVIALGVVAALELMALFSHDSAGPLKPQLLSCVILTLASSAIVPVTGLKGLAALGPVGFGLVLSGILIFISGLRLFDDQHPVLPRLAMTLTGVFYIGGLGSFLTQLRILNGPVAGAFALGLVVGVTKGTDIGAYTFGKIFGRHLMTPLLSPKKTWEGAFGGLIFAVIFAQMISYLEFQVRGQFTLEEISSRLIFALTVSVFGQLGDLTESMMKREARQKDASSIIPGFGGVLDLLDSLFLAAPVGWVILTVLS